MKASVIVLVWNGMPDLAECLNALRSQDYSDLEIIVVDNGSSDGSADFIASQYPELHLIRNERNQGFATGNNLGLSAATGEVLILLNQDTVVRPDWVRALIDAFVECPTCGAAGSKALYPDGRIQHAGGYVNERGEGRHYGYGQQENGQFDQLRDVDYVTGAAFAISRRAMEAVGVLDEGFAAAYFEDVDWCYRVREAGFRVVYAPQAVLVHKERSAAAVPGHEGAYSFQRNRIRLVLKHWSTGRLLDEFLPAETAWLEGLGQGGETLLAAMHHAYLHHLLHLDELAQWRTKALGSTLDDVDALANVLLKLRSTVPLRLVSTPFDAQFGLVEELRRREGIQAQPLRSSLPVLGPLLTAFRGLWNRAVTAAFVLRMLQQQVQFNMRVVTLLQQLTAARSEDEQRWGSVLSEYLTEDGREHSELASELRELRGLLGKRCSERLR